MTDQEPDIADVLAGLVQEYVAREQAAVYAEVEALREAVQELVAAVAGETIQSRIEQDYRSWVTALCVQLGVKVGEYAQVKKAMEAAGDNEEESP